MRHRFVLAVLLALSVSGTLAASVASGATVRPTLRFATPVAPVKLVGTHFQAAERVRVTGLIAGVRVSRYATTSAAGTFTLTFAPTVSLEGCHAGATVLAAGSKGSRALLKLPPRLCVVLAP
jgi:hypothetical protein